MSLAEKNLLEAQKKVYALSENHVQKIEAIIVEQAKNGLSHHTIKTKVSAYRKENKVPRGIKLPNGRFENLYHEGLQQDPFTQLFLKKELDDGTIIKALGNHPDHAEEIMRGCHALGSLAGNNDANRVEIAKQGGIDAIIKALGEHPDHAWVQQEGSRALGNLAFNTDIKQEIIKKGGEKYLK